MFRTIKRLIIPLNIYILINIPVLFLQSRGMLFLTARDMSKATSRVVEDYYSGLFGLYGTPCLAVYCVMIFLGNFVYADKYAARANRKYIKVYNWLLALFFCGFSMINDNKFFYIELVLFGAIYYIAKHRTEGNLILLSGEKTKSKKLWFKVFVLSCGSVVVFLLGYRYISPFRGMIDLFVRKLFQGLNYTNVKGGGERIGMILYVLNSSARFFGFGFACIADEAGTLGFEHFGQADIATFIACGGIAYILLLMILRKILLFRTYNKKLIPFLLLITCFVMMAYTRALRDSSTLVSLMLAFLAIWSVNHPDYLGTGL